MDDYGIAWDYEDSKTHYYHIYVFDGALDGLLDTIEIEIPQMPENDADIQIITDALRRIASRISPQ